MFRHDPQTNRLSLKEGKREPWLRDLALAKGERMRTWLYCLDCQSRYFETGKRAAGHIPFRDRASQSSMRRPADKELVETPDAPEELAAETQPEDVDASPELPLLGDDDGQDEDSAEEVDDPLAAEEMPDPVDTKWPSLEEYQAKWASHLEQHSKPNSGGFSRTNLVPEPIPQLWQDCPTTDRRKVATRGIADRRACARSEPGGVSLLSAGTCLSICSRATTPWVASPGAAPSPDSGRRTAKTASSASPTILGTADGRYSAAMGRAGL